ncbi:Gfo/Idh/MocA family protein [Sphaerisporangium fuscum]|uniref:Gfo/Idh/MocA family protein n=1 Tax=Sphaerisporangium fuscum TaxID=2835868 RepID=UPI0020299499|nr:Gfo/Idh/MocA family oxidoreductase [Sphaerisporangium fuscum]
MDKIRVGIIGANPDRGWAVRAHVPALRALPQYELTAVGTSREDTARAAAAKFGARHAFTDPRRLAEHPDVDLVSITVKVPHHAELIATALAAGKHVLCEWPLALTTSEAEGLLRLADEKGVHHALGLQARYSPAVMYARELVADGYVGRVTSVNLYAANGKGAAEDLPAFSVYTLDKANGAGNLEVIGGHTLDAVRYVLGDITELSAMLSIQRPRYTVSGTDQVIEVTSPDQVLVHANLARGAVLSAHLHTGKVTDGRTVVEIAGTEGDLSIVSGDEGPMGLQISALGLRGSRGVGGAAEDLPVPARFRTAAPDVPDATVLNVAQLYAALAGDIRTGARTVPDFATGVGLHRLLDTIRRAAETGTRQPVLG